MSFATKDVRKKLKNLPARARGTNSGPRSRRMLGLGTEYKSYNLFTLLKKSYSGCYQLVGHNNKDSRHKDGSHPAFM
jgi:hypothetical protein